MYLRRLLQQSILIVWFQGSFYVCAQPMRDNVYTVSLSLIGWAHAHNDSGGLTSVWLRHISYNPGFCFNIWQDVLCKILWRLGAAWLLIYIIMSRAECQTAMKLLQSCTKPSMMLLNLTGVSAALLPRCLVKFRIDRILLNINSASHHSVAYMCCMIQLLFPSEERLCMCFANSSIFYYSPKGRPGKLFQAKSS